MNSRTFQTIGCLSFVILLSGCLNKEKTEDAGRFIGEKFSEHVRSTDPRTPEEERLGFKLPPGFEIELYASEPDIGKPMNISFDAKGRMWVTQSFEYPFPAEGRGKDRITILEDTDGDGRADRFTHFSDTMNIPIGILPHGDGAIAYSIPNVYRFRDSNGDGNADRSAVVLGPFEHKDTHGMVNNFTWGFDGWIHADHGFTNNSTVAGSDGDSITMQSGNTFRFRPDGSRAEQTTYGRVNPFGLAFDELGYLYSVDCHSSPIYQLIRGGDYPHFGKREEGIGFAPDTKPHGEESTALAGMAYYSTTAFPEEFRKNLFIGDVVTCRVHRYSFEFNGSTPVAKAEQDLVMSEDPWFRPVDVELGPDGALYIADFYNRIIGHYEVPLDHPARDRIRGRIWRITYKGNSEEVEDWTRAGVKELLEGFGHSNLKVRLKVANELVQRIGREAIEPLKKMLAGQELDAQKYVHALWALYRLDALESQAVQKAAAHEDPLIRIHIMRILAEMVVPAPEYYRLVIAALEDGDPHVQRAAVEVLANYPQIASVEQLLAFRKHIPDHDTHLLYTTRLCLRNLLREETLTKEVIARQWDDLQASTLADVMTGVNLPQAGTFVFAFMKEHTVPNEQLSRLLEHAARFIPEEKLAELTVSSQRAYGKDLNTSFMSFTAIQRGMSQRGTDTHAQLMAWGGELTRNILNKYFPAAEAGSGPEASSQDISQQRFAVEFVGKAKMASLEDRLEKALQQETADRSVRVSAARSLMQLDPEENASLAGAILKSDSADLELRKQMAIVLGEFPGGTTREILNAVNNAPAALQVEIVKSLVNSPGGVVLVFEKVKKGEIFPRTLLDPQVKQQLSGLSPALQKEYDSLTANIPPVSEEKQALLWERMANFNQTPRNEDMVKTGREVFVQNCSACHQINGDGGMIGPQLTGIGNWGANALAEKILDPNRNVSESFRNYIIKTRDGKTLTGLFRREEGETIVFADVTGKEFSVAKADIAEQEASEFTLMPGNFGEVLSQDDFNKLLSYLLKQK
ncbi:putative membrane-bound dehydrogenase-like protein [Anseongella ginsenosidimutans]|uniref:Putative membrane-bound dehydrogenase-like protein n=1 Tax=Anseongella ginsenosidimutans TaxID=496056 RepID=A0A4V2UUA8_9SPHI|nr:PVC-type heme-binding CxxCH protein [Anseongella ginsenosidimutans]QEC51357.1 c-type cytochrome [Anseongella ginsenosidimutans]TCS89943.1 putative membrane-bound dehydrogenase-like protein [Anseongella ginsenosidimutans]